jgi:hypothetical protein
MSYRQSRRTRLTAQVDYEKNKGKPADDLIVRFQIDNHADLHCVGAGGRQKEMPDPVPALELRLNLVTDRAVAAELASLDDLFDVFERPRTDIRLVKRNVHLESYHERSSRIVCCIECR